MNPCSRVQRQRARVASLTLGAAQSLRHRPARRQHGAGFTPLRDDLFGREPRSLHRDCPGRNRRPTELGEDLDQVSGSRPASLRPAASGSKRGTGATLPDEVSQSRYLIGRSWLDPKSTRLQLSLNATPSLLEANLRPQRILDTRINLVRMPAQRDLYGRTNDPPTTALASEELDAPVAFARRRDLSPIPVLRLVA